MHKTLLLSLQEFETIKHKKLILLSASDTSKHVHDVHKQSRERKKKKVEEKNTNAIRNTQKQSKTVELCWHLISVLYIVEKGKCLEDLFARKYYLREISNAQENFLSAISFASLKSF